MANRSGKLVKKSNERLMNVLEFENYPWLHFNEQIIIFPDNARKSIILEKMHDPLEYKEKISDPKSFSAVFGKKTKPIIPTDMTEDFKKAQLDLLKRKRRNLMDEEEVVAMELAELKENKKTQNLNINKMKLNKEDDENNLSKFKTSKTVDKEVTDKEDTHLQTKINDKEDVIPEIKKNTISEIDETLIEKAKEDGYANGFKEGRNEGFEKGKQEGKDEGFKKGLEEGSLNGYQSGEERGMIAAESKYERAFNNISEAAIKMDNLKVALLQEGKDIFLELVKLCSEKILQEQIKGSDESLYKLFDEVVSSYASNKSLIIQMNSTDSERLKKHLEKLNENDRIQIKENSSLEIGCFQIESDTGVSLVDIKKNINNIIESMKADLFKDLNNSNDKKETDEIKKAV